MLLWYYCCDREYNMRNAFLLLRWKISWAPFALFIRRSVIHSRIKAHPDRLVLRIIACETFTISK